jgi:GTP cyclohydrolase IA
MEEHYRSILEMIGEDPGRGGLLDTPARASKAMSFLTRGYSETLEQVVNDALFDSVAYVPTGKVLGLSKVARIVDMYARRLQIQENLTKQIAEAIQTVTDASGVGVIIEAQHMCMMMRGVEKQNSKMKTSVMLGSFRDNQSTRMEFLSLISS